MASMGDRKSLSGGKVPLKSPIEFGHGKVPGETKQPRAPISSAKGRKA